MDGEGRNTWEEDIMLATFCMEPDSASAMAHSSVAERPARALTAREDTCGAEEERRGINAL